MYTSLLKREEYAQSDNKAPGISVGHFRRGSVHSPQPRFFHRLCLVSMEARILCKFYSLISRNLNYFSSPSSVMKSGHRSLPLISADIQLDLSLIQVRQYYES